MFTYNIHSYIYIDIVPHISRTLARNGGAVFADHVNHLHCCWAVLQHENDICHFISNTIPHVSLCCVYSVLYVAF